MDLCSLNIGEWTNILSFVQLPDLSTLRRVCRAISTALSDDSAHYAIAQGRYPTEAMGTSLYDSWEALLREDNARAGVYVKQMNIVSMWLLNQGNRFYINSVRCMVWDRLNHKVLMLVEAYGNADLRLAHTTSLFRITGDAPEEDIEYERERRRGRRSRGAYFVSTRPPRGNTGRFAAIAHEYLVTSNSYNLCLLRFHESSFPGATRERIRYKFTYNGSWDTDGSDYPCNTLIDPFTSLQDFFSLEDDSCEFVPRDSFRVAQSDVTTWGHPIPDQILLEQRHGRWGRQLEQEVEHFTPKLNT